MALLDEVQAGPLGLLASLTQTQPMSSPAPIAPISPIASPAPKKTNTKAAAKDFANTLLFSLGESLKAGATAPGGRGTAAGMGAALQAPMLLQELRKQEADKQEQKRLAGEALQRQIAQQDFANLIAQGNLGVSRTNAQTALANATKPQAKKGFSGFGTGGVLNQDTGEIIRPPDKPAERPDNSLSETELALRAAGGDATAKAAWDMIKDLKAKEKAAGAEPGTYVTLTDQQGKITGFVNPKTQRFLKPEDIAGMPSDSLKNAMSPERQKMQENAKSGLRAIATLKEELKKPGVLAALAVPNSPTARKARAARAEMVDVMTRLRTGAALNKDEQTFYRDQAPGLIDALFNDPSTIDYKLSIFADEFNGLAGTGTPNGGGAIEELEFGPDGKLRAKGKK